jgi:hypothetical protein
MSEQMENPENVILADAARLTRDMQRGSEVVALLGEQVRRLRRERDHARQQISEVEAVLRETKREGDVARDALEEACAETDSWKEHAKSVQAARSEGRRAALLEAAEEARLRAGIAASLWPGQEKSTYPHDALMTLADVLEAEANAQEAP